MLYVHHFFNPLGITGYGEVWLNLSWSWHIPVFMSYLLPLWLTKCWSFVFPLQVIPFSRGSAWEQPPPDLASYLYKNRIVYLGMSLVPSVTELILAEFLYLQYEDEEKPIYLYVNSTGTTKVRTYWFECSSIPKFSFCISIMSLLLPINFSRKENKWLKNSTHIHCTSRCIKLHI